MVHVDSNFLDFFNASPLRPVAFMHILCMTSAKEWLALEMFGALKIAGSIKSTSGTILHVGLETSGGKNDNTLVR